MKYIYFIILVIYLVLSAASCSDSSKYRSLVERELAKEVRNDSLLQGIKFGMSRREFFSHCWELNKKGLFKAGAGNTTVFFEMERNKKTYYVNFYPKFIEDKIVELPVEYTYPAFAPWNPKYSLDALQKEIRDFYIGEFGDNYLEIPSKNNENGNAYVWVDGNRRLSVYKNIMRNSVTALYFDLSFNKELEAVPNDTGI